MPQWLLRSEPAALTHLLFLLLVSGGKFSVVLPAEDISEFLLDPPTSALVKVRIVQRNSICNIWVKLWF
jgi:hypothetical protein